MAPSPAVELVMPRQRLPHPALRHLVEHYSGYEFDAGTALDIHRGLPSPVMTVVLAFGQGLDVGWFGDPGSRATHRSVASGLHTLPAEIHQAGVQSGIQLSVTAAGARVLFGLPFSALAAEIVSLDDVLPARLRDLHPRLEALDTWEARYDVVDAALLGQALAVPTAAPDRPRSELEWAWRQIVELDGRPRVGGLADELGWSRRHLTGQFRAEFGLTPKQLGRVSRFQYSRTLMAKGEPLAEVAATAGFADQAHLTREWRAMSGYTPAEWLRAEFPFLQDLEPATGHSGSHE